MHPILGTGRKALERLASLYEGVCVALLVAMLAINALKIVSRGLFDISLNWV